MANRLYDRVQTQLNQKLNDARDQNNVTLKASTEAVLDRLGGDLKAGKKLVQSVEVMKYIPAADEAALGRAQVSAAKEALENIKTTKHSKVRAAMSNYYGITLGANETANLLGKDLAIAIRENGAAPADDTVKFIHAVDAVHELYDQLFNTGFNPATKEVQIEAKTVAELVVPGAAAAAKTSISIENVRQLRDQARRVLYPYVAAFLRTFELNDVAIRRIYARADTNMMTGANTAGLNPVEDALAEPVTVNFTRPAALAALGAFSQISGPFSDTVISSPAAMLALTSNPAIAKYGLGGLSFPMRIKVGSSGAMSLGMRGGAKKRSGKKSSKRRSGRKMTGGEQRAEQRAEEFFGGDDMPSALNPFAGGAKKRRSGKKSSKKSSKRRVSGGAKKRSSKRRSGRKMTGGEQRAEQRAEEFFGGKKRRSGKKSSKRRSSGGAKKRSSKRRSGRKN
jgi:hypothetical protein